MNLDLDPYNPVWWGAAVVAIALAAVAIVTVSTWLHDLRDLAVSQWRARRKWRPLRDALAEVMAPGPGAWDCPWCTPDWDFGHDVTSRDCTCTEDCGASCCRMLTVAKEAPGA